MKQARQQIPHAAKQLSPHTPQSCKLLCQPVRLKTWAALRRTQSGVLQIDMRILRWPTADIWFRFNTGGGRGGVNFRHQETTLLLTGLLATESKL